MAGINKVIIVGHLDNDPEMRSMVERPCPAPKGLKLQRNPLCFGVFTVERPRPVLKGLRPVNLKCSCNWSCVERPCPVLKGLRLPQLRL